MYSIRWTCSTQWRHQLSLVPSVLLKSLFLGANKVSGSLASEIFPIIFGCIMLHHVASRNEEICHFFLLLNEIINRLTKNPLKYFLISSKYMKITGMHYVNDFIQKSEKKHYNHSNVFVTYIKSRLYQINFESRLPMTLSFCLCWIFRDLALTFKPLIHFPKVWNGQCDFQRSFATHKIPMWTSWIYL